MGQWYQKVTAAVAVAGDATSANELIEALGDPDAIQGADAPTPTKRLAELGSSLRFGDEKAESVWTYVDPYRPRFRYKFGLTGPNVTSRWRETVADVNKEKIT